MIIRRVGVLSAAKLNGLIGVGIGLLIGVLFAAFGMLGTLAGMGSGEGMQSALGVLFGIGGIIIFPLMYGVMGFIGAAIAAWLYNLAAGWVGGLEIEIDSQPPTTAPMP